MNDLPRIQFVASPSGGAAQSGRGLPHSRTLTRGRGHLTCAKRLGLRQSSGALSRANFLHKSASANVKMNGQHATALTVFAPRRGS